MSVEVKGMRQLRVRLEGLKQGRSKITQQWALRTTALAKEKHRPHRKTGTTSASIRPAWTTNSATVKVGGAGLFLERGTGLYGPKKKKYIIKPKNKKALFFASQQALTANVEAAYGEGRAKRAKLRTRLSGSPTSGTLKRYGNLAFAFAKSVEHPGIKADPFMTPAAREALGEIGAKILVDEWNSAA